LELQFSQQCFLFWQQLPALKRFLRSAVLHEAQRNRPQSKIWTNRDDIPHTVVSDDKVFKSKVLDTDEKFSYTFDKAGDFPYFCSVHPKMTGKVIVQ
jgi:Cupredoxin-like domain